MPNPTFVKFAGEMEALFSQEKEIDARRVLYLT
jgi:hypothetical protein